MGTIVGETKEILVEVENLHFGYQGMPNEQFEISFYSSGEQDGNVVLKKLQEKSAFFSKLLDQSDACFKVASKLDPTVKTVIGDKSPIKNSTRVICSLKPKNLFNSSISGSCKLI